MSVAKISCSLSLTVIAFCALGFCALGFCAPAFGALASAQPKPGDLIVQVGGDLLTIDLATRRIATLSAGRFGRFVIGATPSLQRIDASGTRTTLTVLGPGATYGPIVRDQDGSYFVGANNAVLRASGTAVSTVATYPWPVVDLSRDGDTGDLLAVLNQVPYSNYLVRRHAVTGVMTTMTTLTPGGSLAFDQLSGHLFWAWSLSLFLVDRDSGRTLTAVDLGRWQAGGVAVDQPTSLIFVTGSSNLTTAVQLVSRTGVIVGTQAYQGFGFNRFGAVGVWGSRRLAGTGSGDRGSTYALRLSLPLSTGASYCCALSFAGMRPGIPFVASTAHIAPDGLLLATACGRLPGLTTGFAGTLDAKGRANASFRIPSAIPIGTVYTAAAVAANPALPGGVDVTESVSVAVTR